MQFRGYIDHLTSVSVPFVDIEVIISIYKGNILHERNVKESAETFA